MLQPIMSQNNKTAEHAYNITELGDTWTTISRTVVEDEQGRRAIAFLSARIDRGRVKFQLTTKKSRHKETIVNATADWVI